MKTFATEIANVDVKTDSNETPNAETVRCGRCQTECAAPSAGGPQRCSNCGSFLPGNVERLTHGQWRYHRHHVLPPDLKQPVDEFRTDVISDQGGVEELSAVRAGLVRLLVDCEVGKRLQLDAVIRHGVDTPTGRKHYDRLLATVDRWLRIAEKLGIDRRQRQVMTFAEVVRASNSREADE